MHTESQTSFLQPLQKGICRQITTKSEQLCSCG